MNGKITVSAVIEALHKFQNQRKRCTCKDIEFGSYKACVPLWDDFRKRVVYADVCLAIELNELWKRNITTIECCCGHNKENGYIAVNDSDYFRMQELGYEAIPDHPNCYYPKYTTQDTIDQDFNNPNTRKG